MTRALTQKEHQVFTTFQQKLVLQEVDATLFTVLRDNKQFNCVDPVIYKIEGTDAHLIFGSLQSGFNLAKIQEELRKLQKSGKFDMADMEKAYKESMSTTCTDASCTDNTCTQTENTICEGTAKEGAVCDDIKCKDKTCNESTCKDASCNDATCKDGSQSTVKTYTCTDTACNDTICDQVNADKPKLAKEDVKTVMEQTGCSEQEAIQALTQCEYDIVDAIMMLEEKSKK